MKYALQMKSLAHITREVFLKEVPPLFFAVSPRCESILASLAFLSVAIPSLMFPRMSGLVDQLTLPLPTFFMAPLVLGGKRRFDGIAVIIILCAFAILFFVAEKFALTMQSLILLSEIGLCLLCMVLREIRGKRGKPGAASHIVC